MVTLIKAVAHGQTYLCKTQIDENIDIHPNYAFNRLSFIFHLKKIIQNNYLFL